MAPTADVHIEPTSPVYQSTDDIGSLAGMPVYPNMPALVDGFGTPALGYSPPAPPLPLNQVPPWATHNPYAAAPLTPITPATPQGPAFQTLQGFPGPGSQGFDAPLSAQLDDAFGQMDGISHICALGMSRASLSSFETSSSSCSDGPRKGRSAHRTWSLKLENRPNGLWMPIGTRGSDGTFIAHGKSKARSNLNYERS